MKFIYQVKAVILCVGLLVSGGLADRVQAEDIDLLCYVVMPDQRIVDLGKMCGRTIQKPRVLSPAERKAQFLQNFYAKVQSHPAGKEILEQSDPDALIGKANQVCNAIKEGTYQPPQAQPNPDEPDERRIANLEEAFVDQVASQGFCVESK
ncbi:hypothetical protein QUA62_23655 [Microcoleus sp. MON1_C1]|uniref:hypothetical protein n=1 Tax=Microcoleus sp. MON1_C1 TaxID=2818827 RepID=UPI002FD7696B